MSEVEAKNEAIAQGKELDSAVPGAGHGEGSATPQGTEDVAGKQDVGTAQVQVAADTATSPRRKTTKQLMQPNRASENLEAQGNLSTSQRSQVSPAKKSKTKAARPEKPGTHASPKNVTTRSTLQPVIRLYTSQHRMWHAITGHGPDEARVKVFDFACLSVIAASGPQGILQHDLTSITGQDKRSLPSRTDRLRDDGYIVKKPETTWIGEPRRRLHTSRCTLARYTTDKVVADEKTDATDGLDHSIRKKKKMKAKRDTGVTQGPTTPTAQLEPPVVPQWTSNRTVGNQIFDLVHRSGTRGMSASVSSRHLPEDSYCSICSFTDRNFERACSVQRSKKSQKTMSQDLWKAGRYRNRCTFVILLSFKIPYSRVRATYTFISLMKILRTESKAARGFGRL